MDIDKIYLARIRKMKPARRLLIAVELTQTVRDIAMKGIMDSEKVNYAKAKKILQKRLMK